MAFYGQFDVSGYLLELLHNPSPVPVGAVQLTNEEVLTILNPGTGRMQRVGPDEWKSAPVTEAAQARVDQALHLLYLSERVSQGFVEERLAIALGSSEITSTTIPNALGVKLLEFRSKLRTFLLKNRSSGEPIPSIPGA